MYNAIICRVKVKPHPNADRIQLGEVFGNQVIVGLETKDDDLGVFFPSDGQLSVEYCEANDLLPRYDENNNKLNSTYFSDKRRVRAQSFRGEKSEGYWSPISSLAFLDYPVDEWKEGFSFNEINGVPICNKYVTQSTKGASAGNSHQRRKNNLFLKHPETRQLKYEIDQIHPDSILTISEKLHGTSHRFGYVIDTTPINWFKKFLNTYIFHKKVFKPKKEFAHLHGSRNVILNDEKPDEFYKDNFRFDHFEDIKNKLNKNEIIYGELVGYTNAGSCIMDSHKVDILIKRDKKLGKKIKEMFGDPVTYYYGCEEGQSKFYVYRIITINEDGDTVELSWPQVKARCRDIGLEHVPEIITYYPSSPDVYHDESFHEFILKNSVMFANHPETSYINKRQLKEGIVLRVDDPNGKTYFLKEKAFAFKVLEDIAKEDDSYIDIEEAS